MSFYVIILLCADNEENDHARSYEGDGVWHLPQLHGIQGRGKSLNNLTKKIEGNKGGNKEGNKESNTETKKQRKKRNVLRSSSTISNQETTITKASINAINTNPTTTGCCP